MPSWYEQEKQRKAAERAAAPQNCPHCGTPINQSEYDDRIRYHCGADKCRKAASRTNLAERKRQERSAARAHILHYCEQQLDQEQLRAVMEMTDLIMGYDYQHGHELAAQVVKVIEDQRCKHDRISVLIDNASAAKRQAEKAEEYNAELKAVYERRIEELQAELHVYQLLESAVHNIATRQLAQQPDPQERQPAPEAEQPDPDRARVLATLAHIGVKPYTGQQEEDEDDTEGSDEEEEDEDSEE